MAWDGMASDRREWHGIGLSRVGWDEKAWHGMAWGLLQVTAMLCHLEVVAAGIHVFSTTESLAKCKTRSDLQ